MTSELTVQASSLSAIASAIRSKTGETSKYSLTQMATKISSLSNKVTAYSSAWSTISGKTTLTSTTVSVTIPETGTYKICWGQYAQASHSNTYAMLYKNGASIAGTSVSASIYSAKPPAPAYVSAISLSKNDVITLYARTSSTSTARYINLGGLYAEKI